MRSGEVSIKTELEPFIIIAEHLVLRAEILGGLPGLVVVVDTHDRLALVAHGEQLGNVVPHDHVAVHEQRPAVVVHQARDQEAGVDEVIGPVGMGLVVGLQIVQRQRRNRQHVARKPGQAVGANMIGNRFTRIETNKNIEHY